VALGLTAAVAPAICELGSLVAERAFFVLGRGGCSVCLLRVSLFATNLLRVILRILAAYI